MPRIAVIDLSHHNTISSTLKAAKDAGVVGVIHKATESTGYVDPKYEARRALAKDAGLLWGAYHFLRREQVVTQLTHFLRNAQPDDDTLMACDYEDPSVSIAALVDFMTALSMKLGRSPVLYCGNVLKEKLGTKPVEILSQYRLWLAQYGPTPHPPAGWTRPWLWQYSDGNVGPTPHTVPGIHPTVDCNHYSGSDDQLRAEWAGGKAAQPARQPEPEPSQVVQEQVVKITIEAPTGVRVEVNQS